MCFSSERSGCVSCAPRVSHSVGFVPISLSKVGVASKSLVREIGVASVLFILK